MMEDLVKLMVERWYLPETQVREFLKESFGSSGDTLSLEELRALTGSLVQDTILDFCSENEASSP